MYVQPEDDEEQSSASYKFRQLLKIREELFMERKSYNEEVFKMRSRKQALVTYVQGQLDELAKIHLEIPPKKRRFPSVVPVIDEAVEYPDVLMNASARPGSYKASL